MPWSQRSAPAPACAVRRAWCRPFHSSGAWAGPLSRLSPSAWPGDQVQPLLHDGHFGSCPSLAVCKPREREAEEPFLSGLLQCDGRAIYVALVPSWGQRTCSSALRISMCCTGFSCPMGSIQIGMSSAPGTAHHDVCCPVAQ